MNSRIIKWASVLLFFFFALPDVHAQVEKITFDLQKDKPKKFKDTRLRSEKTGEKKFTAPRRFIQNTTSHYNYFFNANNKMNEIIDRAKAVHRDDFTQLLSFYNYDLNET